MVELRDLDAEMNTTGSDERAAQNAGSVVLSSLKPKLKLHRASQYCYVICEVSLLPYLEFEPSRQ